MESLTFVLFGATGDLAKRKIYPALYNLFIENKLSLPISVVGLGRKEIEKTAFQNQVRASIKEFSRQKPEEDSHFSRFIESFDYCALDVTNKEDYQKLLYQIIETEQNLGLREENRMFYLSVAPEFFDVIAHNIKESGLGDTKGWKKLIIEKPFGHDLKTAQILNEKLSKSFEENEIYRIDHYLGKAMVQNIEALRFANPLVESLWNNNHIANIQFTASEIVGVEQRASYYDHSGAIRDMVQNHMLQMLMMIAMEPSNTGDIRDEKIKALKSISPLQVEQVGEFVVRAQYGAGKMGDKEVVGYKEEPGVDPNSTTDTFVAAKFMVENTRWSGVPFYVRTGKRMKEKSTQIVVEFKNLHNEKFENTQPNLFVIQINPSEGVSFLMNSKDVLKNGKIETINVDHTESSVNVPEAYERLINDAICGNSNFFARWDEVEYSWKLVQPILDAFEKNLVVHEYPAGSQGPKAAHELLEKDGFHWWE
ncbi:glucose-6-phosphate dehydrogenase [Bacillus thuringiensis]|uniref:Glucose-6-phosphate 1-dehydrogenase n=1 Tax=Bacillus thuringiensis TaxID=1428 RepID=A0A9X6WI87_BACTU|nr:glucose-6-phosphate dehydrogenase [Bacillus thuringiensis]PFJ29388.1 glucose-6-phosphate dehydrogenase [Bacillus thuringiensis]